VTSLIHPTAIIAESAKIAASTAIGPYSVIGPHVELGEQCHIASHVVIEGYTKIGAGSKVFQFASVGAIPQDLKYKGEPSTLEIGKNNIIREYVTLQPGTAGGGMKTTIGDGNLFMATVHVGHDATIGEKNIFANGVALAGHVTIGNRVTLGGLSAVHQFCHVGDLSILSGGTMLVNDMPSFCMAQGDRAKLIGLNQIGLERAGLSEDDMLKIKKIYKILFLNGGIFKDNLILARDIANSSASAQSLVDFCSRESDRGICHARKS